MGAVDFDELLRRRRGRPEGGSRYRAFIRALKPGVVAEWPIEAGRSHEGVRSAMHFAVGRENAARRERGERELRIITSIVGETLYVGLAPDDPPAPGPKRPRAKRS